MRTSLIALIVAVWCLFILLVGTTCHHVGDNANSHVFLVCLVVCFVLALGIALWHLAREPLRE